MSTKSVKFMGSDGMMAVEIDHDGDVEITYEGDHLLTINNGHMTTSLTELHEIQDVINAAVEELESRT